MSTVKTTAVKTVTETEPDLLGCCIEQTEKKPSEVAVRSVKGKALQRVVCCGVASDKETSFTVELVRNRSGDYFLIGRIPVPDGQRAGEVRITVKL